MSSSLESSEQLGDLLVSAIKKAADSDVDSSHLKGFSLELLEYIENKYVGEIDAAGRNQITLEVYRMIEWRLRGGKS